MTPKHPKTSNLKNYKVISGGLNEGSLEIKQQFELKNINNEIFKNDNNQNITTQKPTNQKIKNNKSCVMRPHM